MNYEKLTPEKFTEKLKDSSYDSLTGARRAIGKASWPETAKATARTQAEKFFGGTPTKAPKKKAEKITAKKTAKAPVRAKAKDGPKRRAGHPAAEVAEAPQHAGFSIAGRQLTLADVRKNPFQVIQLSEHCVASGTSVLNALTEMKKQNPDLDVTEPTATAVKTIQNGLDLASRVILSLANGMDAGKALEEVIINGVVRNTPEAAMPGETVYVGPGAEA